MPRVHPVNVFVDTPVKSIRSASITIVPDETPAAGAIPSDDSIMPLRFDVSGETYVLPNPKNLLVVGEYSIPVKSWPELNVCDRLVHVNKSGDVIIPGVVTASIITVYNPPPYAIPTTRSRRSVPAPNVIADQAIPSSDVNNCPYCNPINHLLFTYFINRASA